MYLIPLEIKKKEHCTLGLGYKKKSKSEPNHCGLTTSTKVGNLQLSTKAIKFNWKCSHVEACLVDKFKLWISGSTFKPNWRKLSVKTQNGSK